MKDGGRLAGEARLDLATSHIKIGAQTLSSPLVEDSGTQHYRSVRSLRLISDLASLRRPDADGLASEPGNGSGVAGGTVALTSAV
jgi:hypothetical protein